MRARPLLLAAAVLLLAACGSQPSAPSVDDPGRASHTELAPNTGGGGGGGGGSTPSDTTIAGGYLGSGN